MSKRVGTVEGLVEHLEPGGMLITSKGDICSVDTDGDGGLLVRRSFGLPGVLSSYLGVLLEDGPVGVLSRTEVASLYRSA